MKRLLAFVLLALCTACRTLPFPEPDLEGVYGQALKQWTRKVALYSGLETRAFVRVVYLSPQFVKAQAKEIATLRAELPDQSARTLAQMEQEYAAPSFFAIVYVPDKTANDWDQKDSVWRIALNEGLGEVAPTKVVRIDRPFNAELRTLYPYLDEYSEAYQITFPPPSPPAVPAVAGSAQPAPRPDFQPQELDLIVAGALGKMVFHWRVDGGQGKPTEAVPAPDLQRPTHPTP